VTDEERGEETPDERTALLSPKAPNTVEVTVVPVEQPQSVTDLLKDPYFWVLAVIVLCTLGSCEMVISNIGTIVLSLPRDEFSATAAGSPSATATQVRLLSVCNTVSRLLVGPLADFVSPVAAYLPCGTVHYPRKHRVSRVAFLSGASALLIVTFAWMEVGVRSQQAVWALSLGTGIAYGAVFTILPSLVSSVWGLSNLGRNFGVITYAPFIGTPLFSYLYAFVAASNAAGDSVCKGVRCWSLTFATTTAAAGVSLLLSVVLWRRWRGKV